MLNARVDREFERGWSRRIVTSGVFADETDIRNGQTDVANVNDDLLKVLREQLLADQKSTYPAKV